MKNIYIQDHRFSEILRGDSKNVKKLEDRGEESKGATPIMILHIQHRAFVLTCYDPKPYDIVTDCRRGEIFQSEGKGEG